MSKATRTAGPKAGRVRSATLSPALTSTIGRPRGLLSGQRGGGRGRSREGGRVAEPGFVLAPVEQGLRHRGGAFQRQAASPSAGPRRVGLCDGIERGKRRAGEKRGLALEKVARRPAGTVSDLLLPGINLVRMHPCRFASSGTVASSRSASSAIFALNAGSNLLRDFVISRSIGCDRAGHFTP